MNVWERLQQEAADVRQRIVSDAVDRAYRPLFYAIVAVALLVVLVWGLRR